MGNIINIVLLCIGSVFLARVLERKMKVASIAHSVLFIMMSMYFLLTSNNEMIALAMSNIFGKEYYALIHNALVETAEIYQITMITLFAFESFLVALVAFIAVLAFIKASKYILRKIRSNLIIKNVDNYIPQFAFSSLSRPINNKQGTYLVLSHFRN